MIKILFANTFWGNSLENWAIAAGIILGGIALSKLFQVFVIRRLQQIAAKTSTNLDDFAVTLIRKSGLPMAAILFVYIGLNYLTLPEKAIRVIQIAFTVAIVFFTARSLNSFIRYIFYSYLGKEVPESQKRKEVRGILLIIQCVIWLIATVFLVDNLGYNITTIITGLGIGGIAIALASQAILADLFSYLVIFFDKPFEPGDFIIVDEKVGVVEYIGIKTTRIRAISGEQLICSNTDLTNSRVHNYKRMQERRVVFSIGITYGTVTEKLKKIPGMIKTIIESVEATRFDRAHFKEFGDFSLLFEIVYFVSSPDYILYMDTQQSINLQLAAWFEKENIEFAFPTQTIYLQQERHHSEKVLN